MKILYQVYAKITTTKKKEKIYHEVIHNDYSILRVQTEHYIEQVKQKHAELFEKRGKKNLVTIVTIKTIETK